MIPPLMFGLLLAACIANALTDYRAVRRCAIHAASAAEWLAAWLTDTAGTTRQAVETYTMMRARRREEA